MLLLHACVYLRGEYIFVEIKVFYIGVEEVLQDVGDLITAEEVNTEGRSLGKAEKGKIVYKCKMR